MLYNKIEYISLFIEKIYLLFNRYFKIFKNQGCLLFQCKIIFFIIIFIYLQYFFSLKMGLIKTKIYTIERFQNYGIISQLNKENRFITVKNVEGEPNTIAEILIQNNIDYIPKVSVIIPVYNTEEYIAKCLETVINQTLKEIEIICIDDGSSDNSLNILKKFAEKDERITIIKQENFHAGVARNAGLAIAKGEYLSFLDSDDFFELNMLEEMYKKIVKKRSDIIISQCKSIDLDTGEYNEEIFNTSLRLELIPEKDTFSVLGIALNIFQLCEGWAWDKLFRTEFILSNNIRFQNLIFFNDNQFTYTALCLSKSITTIKKRFVIKRHLHKKSLSANRNKDPSCFLKSFNKIKSNLKKFGLYDLLKESFWKWAINLCFIQLKNLNNNSKEYLFNLLHEKFNLWDYIDKSPVSTTRYRALHYLKYQKVFPTINILYIISNKNFNFFLVSLVSILKNSAYENFNIILFYNDDAQIDLQKINLLKTIRSFTLQILHVSDEHFKDFQLTECPTNEDRFPLFSLIKFFCENSNFDKIIYISSNTIIRKSLLYLLEINMDNKLVAGTKEFSFSKDDSKQINLKDNLYINDKVLLLNIKEWRSEKLYNKILSYIRNNNPVCITNQDILNIFSDRKKILLNREYNYMEISEDNIIQFDYEYLELYKIKYPTIIHYSEKQLITKINNDSLTINEFLKYKTLLNKLFEIHLSIPIVLSSDNQYAPFMYTTIISILENGNRNTYYIFYLLVPSDFSKNNENLFLELYDKYKCYIYFIYLQNIFENVIMKIPHITIPTFYRLLIGELLPKEVDKCIYLDADICVRKDLSKLFNIELQDNYIAGVVSPSYYFDEKRNCKRLNLPSMKQYVNAGMLIINLKQIRKDNMTKKFIELSKKNYNSQDQDVLNVACYGKIITLPPKYNSMVLILKENNPLLNELYEEEDIIEAKNDPYIVHYSNRDKPWNKIGIYMEKYWWDIAKKTPYISSIFNRENLYKSELKKFWYEKKNKILDLERPRTFNEKIQWLKLYDSTPIKSKLSDKFLVREWVSKKIGEDYLIPLLGEYKKFDDIDFKKLPNQFVIKCNHGRRYNIIVKNKSELNITDARSKIEKWMKENYAFSNGIELQYRDIEPKIIIEEFMDDGNGDLRDYKFICFNGKPNFICVDSDKHSYHKRNLYDLNWNQLSYKINPNLTTFKSIQKPIQLGRMIELASLLSDNFIYVSIVFYIINDSIYFGGMEFSSESGTEDIVPKNFEKRLASLIILPKKAYNIDTGEFYELIKSYSFSYYYIIFITLSLKLLFNLLKFL